MSSTLKFSVITVSFNHADFIRQTIESVLLQKYENFEHIVIDGGSNDGTIDILKAYPHLTWVSEPDRGQTHALNKGFLRATGDIIAWINSDDWYAPGIFKDIATALDDYPIVMGECELTDKYGCFKELVPNIERNWFDILKYWIFYSSPAQPSIFFKKQILDEVRLANGNYLDEDLDFCMDYDLWLRICRKFPLARRMPRVFSYYRTYESNKTGELMDSTYREMSRVYRRHSSQLCTRERDISIVLSTDQPLTGLRKTIESMAAQRIPNAEVVVVDGGEDLAQARKVRREVILLGREFPKVPVRYVRTCSGSYPAVFNAALDSVRAPLVVWTSAGVAFPPEFCLDVVRDFEQDNLGILLPFANDEALRNIYSQSTPQGSLFKPEGIFNTPFIMPSFIARHIALKELGGFCSHTGEVSSPFIAIRRLLFRMLYKGWKVNADNRYSLPLLYDKSSFDQGLLEEASLYLNAQLVKDLCDELKSDPFGVLRLKNGFSIGFSEEIISSTQKLLALAPPDWHYFERYNSMDQLLALTAQFPSFAVGWWRMRALIRNNGGASTQQATQVEGGYQRALSFQASL